MKEDRFYLIHILDCIARIERYAQGSQDAFYSDSMVSDAILRSLQTLGESAKRLSADTQRVAPEIEWREIIGFRNVLVHEYLSVDLARVWRIVTVGLPQLKKQIEAVKSHWSEQA